MKILIALCVAVSTVCISCAQKRPRLNAQSQNPSAPELEVSRLIHNLEKVQGPMASGLAPEFALVEGL